MSNYGRETIVIVEIDQPRCSRIYGDAFFSPQGSCSAVLGTDGLSKCFNTRVTCQDSDNYSGTDTVTLRFARAQAQLARYYGLVRPSILSLSTTPSTINLGGMDRAEAAMGRREVVSITFQDHLDADIGLDKYRLERQSGVAAFGSPSGDSYNAYTRGSYWGRWLARNPYYNGYPVRVYEGFVGEDLEDMRVRHYVLDKIDGPAGGQITLTAKDRFSQIEARKAVAPSPSQGELDADITGTPATFDVSPVGIGNEDYDAAGYVCIGDEIIQYTRVGDTFTVVTRAALNTDSDDHDAEDLVQQVLVYTAELAHEIIYDLAVNYSEIPAETIYLTDWAARASTVTQLYTGRIAKPVPVIQLIGELCEQAGLSVWPDVRTDQIKLAALRAGAVSPTVDERSWIVDGSFSPPRRQVEKRASRVWVYYGQKNPVEDLTDERNYHSRFLSIDGDAETPEQHGEPANRQVFSRWIPQFGRQAAESAAERLLAMFRDPPIEVSFTIHASRDGEIEYGQYFNIEHASIQDERGDADTTVTFAATSIELGENEIGIKAQSLRFPTTPSAASPSVDVREIFIENSSFNLNIRSIHDSLFQAPAGGESIAVYVLSGVVVGSTSTSSPAMRTGSWPTLNSFAIYNEGRLQGCAGDGGIGGGDSNSGNGDAGAAGGIALLVEVATTLDNTNGEIWGGAGGGGGGAGSKNFSIGITGLGGGGGGGGAGTNAGAAGAGQNWTFTFSNPGSAGSPGSATAGGAGGPGAGFAGVGGDGGAPGQSGATGGTSSFASPGPGGAAGSAISGVGLVTIVGTGDIRGPQV